LEVLNNILLLLKEKNVQQKALSDFLGLSKNTITGWKNGNNTSYMKYLPQIAEFFNVSVDYILGNEQKNSVESDFTYALYNEITHDLSEDQIEQIKKFADFLRNS
jgi:transcriptional regulator with XRE-family HTH domain